MAMTCERGAELSRQVDTRLSTVSSTARRGYNAMLPEGTTALIPFSDSRRRPYDLFVRSRPDGLGRSRVPFGLGSTEAASPAAYRVR